MPHVLVVDDEEEIRSLLMNVLEKHGHRVTLACDGGQMFKAIETSDVDLVILDVMLPGEDGFSLCRRLRQKTRIPVIMVTAMGEQTDRVVGLEIGADDYVVKPFDSRELLARMKAVWRRTYESESGTSGAGSRPVLQFAGWRLDVVRRELRGDDNSLMMLSAAEFDLLLAFAEHPQRVLTRDQLLDLARGVTHDAFDRSIDTQVSRLRRKLEQDPKSPSVIRTVRNNGYIFTPKVLRG